MSEHRLHARMRTYARIELHECGEVINKTQLQDLLLLRARLAALIGKERARLQPSLFDDDVVPTTTNSSTTTTKTEESNNGDAAETLDVPWDAP